MGKKENLQTRREFFRRTIRGALPVIAFLSYPAIISCSKDDDVALCSDCTNSCAQGCATSCINGCSSTSQSASCSGCSSGCSSSCKGTSSANSGENPTEGNGISAETGSIGGHGYVDLGLSVKWATCNIGANSPEKAGTYLEFCPDATGKNYVEVRLSLMRAGLGSGDSIAGSGFDQASQEWGSYWTMPKKEHFEELKNNCTCEEYEINGVVGVRLVSKINNRSIFIPGVGKKDCGKIVEKDSKTIYCWGATLSYLMAAGAYAYVFRCDHGSKGYSIYLNDTEEIANQKMPIRAVTYDSSSTGCGGNCTANCASNSTGSTCSNCASTCSSSCKTECEYNCAATCISHCYGSCNDTCGGTCKYVSAGTKCSGCATTCNGRCYKECSYACSSNCQSSCVHGSK